MTYRVYAELSPKPFLPGDEIHIFPASKKSSFYVNLEDWEGKYKFFIQFDAANRTLTANELVEGEWKGGFTLKAPPTPSSTLSLSYNEAGRYLLQFDGCELELESSTWPGAIRQIGGEAVNLSVKVKYGSGHSVAINDTEIEDELANEMLA